MIKIDEPTSLSISDAKRVLGSDCDLSDQELKALIDQLDSLARAFVQSVLSGDAYAVFMEYNRDGGK